MKLLKRLFGEDTIQSEMIERKFDELQTKMLAEVAGLRAENNKLKSEIAQKDNRITDLLTKLRDQNEADLFLECEKIKKKILDGEKREDINLSHMAALQNMQGSYAAQLAAQRNIGLGSLLGGAWR